MGYIQPQYTLSKFGAYGLLGFSGITADKDETELSESGLQYSAGINLMIAS